MMKIGITYDLRDDYLKAGYNEEETAEFDSTNTIQSIEQTIKELGYEVEPIGNIKSLVRALCSGKSWDLVFNICEGMYGTAREAQVPALLDAYQIPYTFSDPLTLAVCLDKGVTKRIIKDLGIPTAEFTVVEKETELKIEGLKFPLFVKPASEGTGKGITLASRVNSQQKLYDQCQELLRQFKQPVLVEEYLPGREFTVGILGTRQHARALGVLEVILRPGADAGVYSYNNKENCEQLVDYILAEDVAARKAADTALAAWKKLGCRDAGRVDLRQNRLGIPCFMEVNPLAGLNPTHSDLPILCTQLGIPYKKLIKDIIESAMMSRSTVNPI